MSIAYKFTKQEYLLLCKTITGSCPVFADSLCEEEIIQAVESIVKKGFASKKQNNIEVEPVITFLFLQLANVISCVTSEDEQNAVLQCNALYIWLTKEKRNPNRMQMLPLKNEAQVLEELNQIDMGLEQYNWNVHPGLTEKVNRTVTTEQWIKEIIAKTNGKETAHG